MATNNAINNKIKSLDFPATIAQGDILIATSANTIGVVSPGTTDYVLTSTGSGSAPTFQVAPGTLKWGTTSSTAFTAAISRGYILSSTSSVTVTMPTTPTIGDTFGIIKIVDGGFLVEQNSSMVTYFSVTGKTTAGTGHGVKSANTSALYRKVIFTYVSTNAWYVTDLIGTMVIY